MSSKLSVETRLLLNPAPTFRSLSGVPCSGAWVLLRRPILLLVMMSATVSMLGASRLSIRLMADAALSFAFVPIIEIFALRVVYLMSTRTVPFARAVDLFFAGHGPWFIWMLAVGGAGLIQSPRDAAVWTPVEFFSAVFAGLLIGGWAFWIDLYFFREVMPRADGRAGRDLALCRAVAWSLTLGYFFGIAAWPEVAGRIWL